MGQQTISISGGGGQGGHHQFLSEILLDLGKVTKADIDRALSVQKQSRQKLGRILIDLGIISEEDLRLSLSLAFNIPIWEKKPGVTYPLIDFLPFSFLLANKVLPFNIRNDSIDIAIIDPQDTSLLEILRSTVERGVNLFIGTEKDIIAGLEEAYEPEKGEQEEGKYYEGIDKGIGLYEDIEHLKDIASEAPVIRTVSNILNTAIELGASDVHIEIFDKRVSLRYRIDGVLREFSAPPLELYAAIISRIKIMAKLNIAEKRLPQDGRIILKIAGREIDLRVSIIPMHYGEGAVLRILDRSSITLDLDRLGFGGETVKRFRRLIKRSNGMILVTGPTGSGKTTTLYAALKEKVSPEIKIITIEDPIEYSLEGVNQIQVNPQIELTFAAGLRSILRHDPDVILIGEIRDRETAAIAIQSALTGHLVFSTLHTNDAPSAFTRLMDMGIEDYLISSSVIGVLAQRLIRRLCEGCKEPYMPEPEVMTRLKVEEGVKLYRPEGCAMCGHTGYKGRMCISEFLLVNDAIRRLVVIHSDSSTITKEAFSRGAKTLWQDGVEKVVDGLTTMDELIRVSDTSEDDI